MYPNYNNYYPYFGFYEPEYRAYQNNNEITTLKEAIELIKKSISDEKEDELFYDKLMMDAPTNQAKDIIRSIKEDEMRHSQILSNLFYQFTGQKITNVPMPRTTNKNDYKSNLERALFGELDAVVKYRKILGTMPSGNPYTLLMSIMTDELRHAGKFNFLITTTK